MEEVVLYQTTEGSPFSAYSIIAKAEKRALLIASGIFFWPLIYLLASYSLRLLSDAGSGLLPIAGIIFSIFALVGWFSYIASAIILFGIVHYMCVAFQGVASTRNIVAVLDKLLAEKVRPSKGSRVTFGDVKSQTGRDLKIVAANVRSGTMKMFDVDLHKDVAVSDAVAASASIPFLFRPQEIGGSQYCDGGIVSNLPAWTFDKERLFDEDTIVITSELSEIVETDDTLDAPASGTKRGFSLLLNVLQTAMFGAAALNTRGLHNHIRLKLEPSVGLLDFDKTDDLARNIGLSKEIAFNRLQDHLQELKSLELLHQSAQILLDANGLAGCQLRSGLVRAVRFLDKPVAGFRLWHTKGFEEYHDDRLLLPVETSLVGTSTEAKRPMFYDLSDAVQAESYRRVCKTEKTRKVLPKDREWVICIPLDTTAVDEIGNPLDCLSHAVVFDGNSLGTMDIKEFSSQLRDIVERDTIFQPFTM